VGHSLHNVFELLRPSNLLVAMVVLSLAGSLARWRRSRVILAVTAAAAVFITLFPVGEWLALPLESRFPQPKPMPAHVDGIIVLGGAVRTFWTYAHGQPSLNEHAERMTETVALARLYPAARIVFTGGNTDQISESEVARRFFLGQGLDLSRVSFETRSHDTFGNAVLTKALMKPQPGETWVLVTSAYHMPRSVGCFRNAGWTVVPYPVDYETPGVISTAMAFAAGENLERLDDSMREWAALVEYYWVGRTDALFPGPRQASPTPDAKS
jgi:uncharacterized SAM-binding protein YcdF (DUF218 family)